MKKTILLFLLLLPFCSKSSTIDTLSHWKIYYNDSLIKTGFINSDNTIVIKSKNYKPGDYLAIRYIDDIPCENCNYSITVVGEARLEVFRSEFKGKSKLRKIDLKELFALRSQTNESFFIIFFYGLNDKYLKRGLRLVTLKIEN
jgi:hypothetical protein